MIPAHLTDTAISDIGRIWDSLAAISVEAATRISDGLIDSALGLSEFPERHPIDATIKGGRYRRFNVGRYAIIYEVSSSLVEILRIVPGDMDLTQLEARPQDR